MKINKLIFKLLRYSGLPYLIREILQRKKVTILLFHDIDETAAANTFSYLLKKYNIISLSQFLEACRTQDATAIPDKALIITFDDGHIGNYKLLPFFKKHNIPVTIFLCAGIIDTNRHYWFTYKHPDLSTSVLKQISNKEKLEHLAEVGFSPKKEFSEPQALTKSQIFEMQPVIDFQSHTVYHPCLPKCNNAQAREEIFDSKQILEGKYNLAINAFAFPNGDYSERDIALLKEAGYQCGITVDHGFNTVSTDLFRLKRLSINDTGNLDELSVKASGLWSFFKTRNGQKQDHGWTDMVEN